MKNLLLIINFSITSICISLQGFCQTKLQGKVLNSESNEPISSVTIYINGTTNGTTTDRNGNFYLKNIFAPCEIVFSHIGYQIEKKIINYETELNKIFLIPKSIKIKDINVNGKNLRKKLLKHFNNHFLGSDYWGKHAVIENDSVLFFRRVNTIPDKLSKGITGSFKTNSNAYQFIAEATEPLQIALPLLGYNLYVDLIKYKEFYNPDSEAYVLDFLGYFYFKAIHHRSKHKSKKIDKNRLKAFYNSSLHFCRSLFEDSLKENGYLLKAWVPNNEEASGKWKDAEIKKILSYSEGELNITGLKDTSFFILYYPNSKDYQHDINDINKYTGFPSINSEIYFKNDTCIIQQNGITTNNSIVFGSTIGDKRVGAFLPENFSPIKQDTKTRIK